MTKTYFLISAAYHPMPCFSLPASLYVYLFTPYIRLHTDYRILSDHWFLILFQCVAHNRRDVI